MTMNDRPHHQGSAHAGARRPQGRFRRDRSIALVDARFVEWLCDRDEEDATPPQLGRWPEAAEYLLGATAGPTELVRTYWYTRQAVNDAGGAVTLRPVIAETQDAGASLVLAMARDLAALAHHGACDQVLIVCDDDRLLPAIDAAQLQGLQVVMMAEGASADMAAFTRQDASLAAMLRQADARLAIDGGWLDAVLYGPDDDARLAEEGRTGIVDFRGRSAGPRAPQTPHGAERGPSRRGDMERGPRHGGGEGHGDGDDRRSRGRHQPDPSERAAMRERLTPMLQSWWDDLPHEDRQELQERLPAQRGLPQEIDRLLLLKLSQSMGRSLEPGEKVSMREVVRDLVLDGSQEDGVAGRHPGSNGDDAAESTREASEVA
jgi:hypothetical protein